MATEQELRATIVQMSKDHLARIEELERDKTRLALENRKLRIRIEQLETAPDEMIAAMIDHDEIMKGRIVDLVQQLKDQKDK